MLPNRCQYLNKFVWKPHKYWFPKVHFITQTLFSVRYKSCFSLLFLLKSHHFDTLLFLVYMVSKLVYPNCTQDEILPKVVTRHNFLKIRHVIAIRYTACSKFIFVFAYAYPIPHSIQQRQVADTVHLSPPHF